MQKINVTILLIALMSMVGVKAMAHDVEAKNADGMTIYYNYINNSEALQVTYRNNLYEGDVDRYKGNIVIPESVKIGGVTYSVTSVGAYAFYGCTGVTSVTVPSSVIYVNDFTFSGCSSLVDVTIADGADVMQISNSAFNGCPIEKLHLGRTYAYSASSPFTPFKGITTLKSLVIGSNVTVLSESAFNDCTSLTDVTIADGTTTLSFPIRSTNYSHFANCPIESVYMGRDITYTQFGTSSGSSYYVSPFGDKESIVSLTIGDGVTFIQSSAFSGTGLTKLTIGKNVEEIGSSAFSSCSNLTEVVIPNSVTFIGSSAFAYCSSLSEIVIPNSVKTISGYVFNGCSSLTEITIPASVTSIGSYAFQGCTNLTEMVIEDGTEKLSVSNLFPQYSNGTKCYVEKLYLGRDVTWSSTFSCFWNVQSLTSLVVGNSVKTIAKGSFERCSNLTSITIGSGITYIYNDAFKTESADPESVVITSLSDDPTHINTIAFGNDLYDNAMLYVPQGTTDKYKARDGWKQFKYIMEGTSSGISTTLTNSGESIIKDAYDLGGKQLSQPQRGLNIVRMSDGTAKKVVVQ